MRQAGQGNGQMAKGEKVVFKIQFKKDDLLLKITENTDSEEIARLIEARFLEL
jgi:hypothetical protein